MSNKIIISKTKLRRGTDSQRKQIVFDQGELLYTVGTNRLHVGDGSTLGGLSVSTKIHPILTSTSLLTSVNAEIGDLQVANNVFFQLTASDYSSLSSWANVSPKLNPTEFSYSNTNTIQLNTSSISAIYLNPNTTKNGLKISGGILQINYDPNAFTIVNDSLYLNSISASYLNPNTLGSGLIIETNNLQIDALSSIFGFDGNKLTITALSAEYLHPNSIGDGLEIASGKLKVDYDATNFEILSATNQLSIKNSGVSENEISASTFFRGISGGNGNKIGINGSGNFTFVNNVLTLTGNNPMSLDTSTLNPTWAGNGLLALTATNRFDVRTDTSTITISSGILQLNPINLSVDLSETQWGKIDVDQYGRITGVESSVANIIVVDQNANNYNGNSIITSLTSTSFTDASVRYNIPLSAYDYPVTVQPTNSTTVFEASAFTYDEPTLSYGLEVVSLSSAGFVVLDEDMITRIGLPVGRFAIPIFRF